MPPSRGWPNWSTSACVGRSSTRRRVALGDDDDREVLAPRVPALDQVAAALDVDRQLRDQDRVGAAGDAGVHGDPARVAAHDLDHHHAVVDSPRSCAGGRSPRSRSRRRCRSRRCSRSPTGRCRSSSARRRRERPPRRAAAPRRRACPRRRSRRAPSRPLAGGGARARARPRPCTGSCARCAGSCRRAAGSPRSTARRAAGRRPRSCRASRAGRRPPRSRGRATAGSPRG